MHACVEVLFFVIYWVFAAVCVHDVHAVHNRNVE